MILSDISFLHLRIDNLTGIDGTFSRFVVNSSFKVLKSALCSGRKINILLYLQWTSGPSMQL